jgi:hypothetical protein
MRGSMDDGKHFYEKPDFWPNLIRAIFLFTFLISFRSELLIVLRMLLILVQRISNQPGTPSSVNIPGALVVLAINFIIYIVCYFITVKWLSFFVLPAQSFEDRRQVYEHLLEYASKLHGPAVIVRNGELVVQKEGQVNKDSSNSGFASLALVDLASAIVLERRSFHGMMDLSFEADSSARSHLPIRVVGPGICFLRAGEMIRGSVDLRKQFRTLKGIRGFTSDGIELETNVNVIFTVGQAPQVITVIDTKGDGLRVMTINRDTKEIIGINGEIDQDDQLEIYANIQGQKRDRAGLPASEESLSNRPPFFVNEDHIISAVISQPRNSKDGKLEDWTELPVQVAASVLLDELSRVSYNQLYSLDHL